MRGIFFEENSERLGRGASRTGKDGVRAARAGMGAMGVVRIAPDSLTRQLPTTPKGKRGGKGRLRVGGLRIKNNFY